MDADAIFNAIRQTYGSLEEPRFEFVQRALDSDLWGDVIAELRAVVEAEEITDPNTDVSRTFVLQIGQLEKATLQLSFIGPYAVLFRHRGTPRDIYLSSADSIRNHTERHVVELLHRRGLRLLDYEILSRPIPLKLFETDPDRVRLYQALFSDVEFIPGEYGNEA